VQLRRCLLAVFVLALASRIGAQVALGAYLHPETWEYETIANNLLAGDGYSYSTGGTTYLAAVSSPLYVLLTAGVYLVTGHSQGAMLVLQALFGALTALLVAWVAGRAFGVSAAWTSGGLVAVDPALNAYAAKLHPLSLDALAFVAVVSCAIALSHRPDWRRLSVLGALLGLAALTRTTVLSFAPLLLVWLSRFKAVQLLSPAALLVVLVSAVVYAPWPVRNSLLLGQFVPGSSESTEWLWRGTNPAATGGSLTTDGRTMLQVAPSAFQVRVASASEAERISIYRDAAVEYVREHPTNALALYLAKLRAFWFGSDATGQLYPSIWTALYNAWYAIVALLALVGGWWSWRQPSVRPAVILIMASLALVSASQAVFYVEGRHRLAIEPLLLVLSGAGLVQLASMVGLEAWIRRPRDVKNALS
jgi:4-amino-4-deoxy-L-arabinose transferase-like glycosyltransferase